jgi:hypothetical protein
MIRIPPPRTTRNLPLPVLSRFVLSRRVLNCLTNSDFRSPLIPLDDGGAGELVTILVTIPGRVPIGYRRGAEGQMAKI